MPYFKDFNKDVKDLLSKNYAENGAWKLESKYKGPEKTVFFNPQATHKGVSVDVEYNFKPFKSKVTLNDKHVIAPKVTYEQDGHKVEATVDTDKKVEVTYEGKVGPLSLFDKVTNHNAEASLAYGYGPFSVGGGAVYSLEKQALKGWSAGLHFAEKGYVVDVVTDSLKTYTTGVAAPLEVAGQKFTVAAQTVCGPATKSLGWAVGVEANCILVEGAKLRLKVDQAFKVSVAWAKKFGDNWKVAIGIEPLDKKFGFTFTRE